MIKMIKVSRACIPDKRVNLCPGATTPYCSSCDKDQFFIAQCQGKPRKECGGGWRQRRGSWFRSTLAFSVGVLISQGSKVSHFQGSCKDLGSPDSG